ncbi:flagellar hook-associated protein FlgK [Roseixanthobacter pseudopolyaromaticivorans]|uniref:flagellar hook-associated protein FlgK n=1 Tax=Xanthobacteraceae TaxID=335928 RepID=UPI00372B0575
MSLTTAFNTAQSSLLTTATQLATSSRNVAGAGDPSASRKITVTTTTADGSARVVNITRASDNLLYERTLRATSASAGQQAVLQGLGQLQLTVGDTTSSTSPAAKLGALDNALNTYANAPDNTTLATAVVTAAKDVAIGLNTATMTVQQLRGTADSKIADAVSQVNDLLTQFQAQNTAVVVGSENGIDVTDALDKRDAILSKIAEKMGVTTVTRAHNDMVVYTDSGATLFETTARTVSFKSTPVFDAATSGNSVFVDGVSVSGPSAAMPVQSGEIAGLTTVRDSLTVTYQNQLDEVARGLVATFAESDQSASGAPTLPGLFTPGSASVPGALTPGLAGVIAVNSAFDPTLGGSPALLRDGGANGAAYVVNTASAAAYSAHLQATVTTLEAARTFDPAGQLSSRTDLATFAAGSVSWLEAQRQSASAASDSASAVLSQASNALSTTTGINLDQEYAAQLELERSYQASSKLIGVVGQLYDSLFAAIR